jgi:exopolysaccharide production protein ExoY
MLRQLPDQIPFDEIAESRAPDEQNVTSVLGGAAKRGLDLTVASLALLLAFPLMLLIGILVMVCMGSPIIFAHRRVGYNGRLFRCYKFRTMVLNGDDVLQRYFECNPAAAAEWGETQKLRNDPRITLLGNILRKSSLDELPQLFNVLAGEMSCVGPRPVIREELERYGPAANDYLRTRPGLTGLWQISGRSRVDYARRVVLDSTYVHGWSLWLDLLILIRTIPAVLSMDEAS